MIDFIDISKPNLLGKDTPFFGYCQKVAEYTDGFTKYRLQGCESIEILHKPNHFIRIRGSIMYYWQGHNFSFSHEAFVEAIHYIQGLIKVNLWQSDVIAFEYGVIMPVDKKPKDYIQNHKAKPSEKLSLTIHGKDKGNFARWKDRNVDLKMYDAGRNIKMKQGLNRMETIQNAGWNPDGYYLKWEAHYLKPEVMNHGKGVKLFQLIDQGWQEVFKADLYKQYKRLIPMSNIIDPTDKKNLSTQAIIAIVLAEQSLNNSKTLEEVKKMLYARINAFSNDVLSKSDKDSRRRQIKSILDKIQQSETSQWDLSEKLKDVLANNPDNQGAVNDTAEMESPDTENPESI